MKKSQKLWLALSLLFTLVAMGFHYYLTQKYFALKFSTAEGISACNLTSFLNCDAVSASSYASFLGRPLALWGLVTNLLFFFVQLAVLWNWFSNSRRGFLLTFLFATVLGTASLVMGIISLTMLSQLCLYCTATYILSWLSLGIWTGLTQPKISEIFSFFRGIPTQKSTLGIAVAIPFLTWIFNTFFLDLHGANNVNFERIVQERLAAWHAAPKMFLISIQALRLELRTVVLQLLNLQIFAALIVKPPIRASTLLPRLILKHNWFLSPTR
ncbi:MAG: hypothetical protein IPK04_21055 [Bdellovibrionales bacterium]|nr:hypothetical protein [Bdellovibrionales bacterium]